MGQQKPGSGAVEEAAMGVDHLNGGHYKYEHEVWMT